MDVDTNLNTTHTRVGIVARAKDTFRTDSAGEAQDSERTQTVFFLRKNGTNDHEQPRSVPPVPMFSAEG